MGRIDPDGGWLVGRRGDVFYEAVRVGEEGVFESLLSCVVDSVGLSVVDLVWRHQADSEMVVFGVVPLEKPSAEGFGVLDGAEAFGELRLVFAGFEEAFREGIVIGCVGPAMGLGDAQVGEQQGGGLGFHGGSAVGVQGELAGQDAVLGGGVLEQRFEQGGAFGVGDEPGHDPSG